jgi:hypothetical protein
MSRPSLAIRLVSLLMALDLASCTRAARPASQLGASQLAAPRVDDPAMIIPAAARDSESARLRAFGATVPEGGVVLERPWDPPYTRRSFVVPQSWLRRRAGDSVSADALALDLPVLSAVMERAYGGWETARRRGWNWEKWFADWSAALRAHAGQRLAMNDAFAPMKQFMAFQLDNHTTIPLRFPSFGSGSSSAVIAGSPNAPCSDVSMADGRHVALDPSDPAQRPRHAKRWNSATRSLEPVTYLSLPTNRGIPTSIRCGDESLSMTPVWPRDPDSDAPADGAARDQAVRALSGDSVDTPNFKILEPTVAYLRLPDFDVANGQIIEKRLGSWPTPTGRERVLIVDLRDNEGGSATFAPLAKWVDLHRTNRAENTHRHEGASCLYHALRWGYFSISTSSVKPPVSAARVRQLQSNIDDLFGASPPTCPSEFKDSNGDWDYRQHTMLPPGPVEGHIRIVVLVNDGVGSDAEYMLHVLASLPETVIVGSNSFGVAQYIQPGYSVLPHTRLPFRIALGTSDGYGDRRSFDGYGYDVDILLTTREEQGRETILALARYLGGQ